MTDADKAKLLLGYLADHPKSETPKQLTQANTIQFMSNKQDNNFVPRITGLLILEVRKSNPNGDPERESSPRQRPDGKGEISPVSVKRKLRDLVLEKEGVVWSEIKGSTRFDG